MVGSLQHHSSFSLKCKNRGHLIDAIPPAWASRTHSTEWNQAQIHLCLKGSLSLVNGWIKAHCWIHAQLSRLIPMNILKLTFSTGLRISSTLENHKNFLWISVSFTFPIFRNCAYNRHVLRQRQSGKKKVLWMMWEQHSQQEPTGTACGTKRSQNPMCGILERRSIPYRFCWRNSNDSQMSCF